MRIAVAALFVAGCFSDGTGKVAYTEQLTGHILIVDVATAEQTPLDLGVFGSVSIAPDGQHVAYIGNDFIPKVTDLDGNVIELSPRTGGCQLAPIWGPKSSLQYCSSDGIGGSVIALVPTIGAPVRQLATNTATLTHDGTKIVYVLESQPQTGSLFGDLVVENLDGSDRRVLVSQTNILQLAITPDDSAVVALLDTDYLELDVIELAGGGRSLGTVTGLAREMPHGSLFSPDGTEVLALANSQLVAIALATGMQRHIATLDQNTFDLAAAFLDDKRVISARQTQQVFPPGEGDVPVAPASIHISTGDGADIALAPSDFSSNCSVADIAVDAGLVAITCSVPAVIDFSGHVVTARNAQLALGFTGDRKGMVTVNQIGAIEYVALDGNVKHLADCETNNSIDTTGGLVPPFAAYAP